SEQSNTPKLVVFTEYKDTLNYLYKKITCLLGKEEAVEVIHGSLLREERIKAQERFLNHAEVKILLATDAAGEGINLQRAHLMVNYDLPWNPNRLEQRFGRIHRIGQTEVCYCWNLVSADTKEGVVYKRLLEKIETARKALGGRVFNVLGKLHFEGRPLRELLLEAIQYNDSAEVRERLFKKIDGALDQTHLQELLEERALVRDIIDTTKLHQIRQEMERAEARKLQPHYVESFFLEAFKHLGGQIHEREGRRYEITRVPNKIIDRDREIGHGAPVSKRYERVTFEKELVAVRGKPQAAFLCPGHPLMDATIDIILEQNRDLLRKGTVLVDEINAHSLPRVLFYLEHSITDGHTTSIGEPRVASKRVLYVEIDCEGKICKLNYAPYLDYRPLREDEPSIEYLLSLPEFQWIDKELESKAVAYAVNGPAKDHFDEVRKQRHELIEKTRIAVKERLLREISYWDYTAEQLKLKELTNKPVGRITSQKAREKAEELSSRYQKRMEDLEKESRLNAQAPIVLGGVVVVPAGLLAKIKSDGDAESYTSPPTDTQASAAKAREIVMEIERKLGFIPVDKEAEKLGYDIESKNPSTGKLRFIEVKGRVSGADTITVTKNEILCSLNKPDDYILAVVEFIDNTDYKVYYVKNPFRREPDFGATSVNYKFSELIERGFNPVECE
ncbi:MAG: DUF3883 domain-containing protein, partial [Candidatus Dadabacteria bacterium]